MLEDFIVLIDDLISIFRGAVYLVASSVDHVLTIRTSFTRRGRVMLSKVHSILLQRLIYLVNVQFRRGNRLSGR